MYTQLCNTDSLLSSKVYQDTVRKEILSKRDIEKTLISDFREEKGREKWIPRSLAILHALSLQTQPDMTVSIVETSCCLLALEVLMPVDRCFVY